jgi:hypothetical protein
VHDVGGGDFSALLIIVADRDAQRIVIVNDHAQLLGRQRIVGGQNDRLGIREAGQQSCQQQSLQYSQPNFAANSSENEHAQISPFLDGFLVPVDAGGGLRRISARNKASASAYKAIVRCKVD